MDSFGLMMDAGNYLPPHITPWITWMQVVLFLAPWFFIRHTAARLIILAQVLNTLVAYAVFVWEGEQVTRLFGLGHFFWLWPAAYLFMDLRKQLQHKQQSRPYTSYVYPGYAAVALATIAISLIFDIRDTALWLMGNRESLLVGVPVDHPLYRE